MVIELTNYPMNDKNKLSLREAKRDEATSHMGCFVAARNDDSYILYLKC